MIDCRNVNTLWGSVLVETLHRLGLTTAVVCPGSRSTPLTVAFAQHPHIEAIPIAVAEVEEILAQIESGSLPLEDVFEQFAIATKLLRQCETFLSQGKQRMNLLIETLEPDPDF